MLTVNVLRTVRMTSIGAFHSKSRFAITVSHDIPYKLGGRFLLFVEAITL